MEIEYRRYQQPYSFHSGSSIIEDHFPETLGFQHEFHRDDVKADKESFSYKSEENEKTQNNENIVESDRILLEKIQNLGLTAKLNNASKENEKLTQVTHIPKFTRRSSIESIPRNHLTFEYYPELYCCGKSTVNCARRHSDGIIETGEKVQGKETSCDRNTVASLTSCCHQYDSVESRMNNTYNYRFNVPCFKSVFSPKKFNSRCLTCKDDKCNRVSTFNPFVSVAKMMNRSRSTDCLKRLSSQVGHLKRNSTEIFNASLVEEDNLDEHDNSECNAKKHNEDGLDLFPTESKSSKLITSETDNVEQGKSYDNIKHLELSFLDTETSFDNLKDREVSPFPKGSVKWLKTHKVRRTKREQNFLSPLNF